MCQSNKTPSIFLSHSNADKPAAIELKRRILASPAAKEAGLTVWMDKDDLRPSVVHWQAQIEEAIANATCFVVYIGSAGVINWVENEVRVAISRAATDKTFVFVPIVDAKAANLKALPAFAKEYTAIRDPLNNEEALASLIGAAIGSFLPNARRVAVVDRPFVGLKTMTEAEADLFFGREEEIDELVEMFSRSNLAAIVADSGSGKSSLAQAGFVPAFRGLRSTGKPEEVDDRIRHVVVMRPGDDPLEGLRTGVTHAAEELGRSESQRSFYRSKIDFSNPSETAYQLQCSLPTGKTLTLLIVDQMEEALVRAREKQNEAFGEFLNYLAERRDFCVLITVRQDYFNLLRSFEKLHSKLVANGTSQILRLKRISDNGLDEIIRRPLTMAGYKSDSPDVDSLVGAVKKDVSERPGDLTLIQATLDAVWRNRQAAGGLLAAYANVGGVAGALANEAEITRSVLDKNENSQLLPIFCRLIRPGETAGATRRVALLSEFSETTQKLIQKLAGPETRGGDRLAPLLFVGDHVEIAHEALITQWGWLQDNLQQVWPDLRRLHRLIEKAALWLAADNSRKLQHLATGAEREEYNELSRQHRDWLSKNESEFVKQSQAAFEASEAAAQKQARDRTNQNWWLRLLTVGLATAAVVLVVALITNVISLSRYIDSNRQYIESNRQYEEANTKLIATSAELGKANTSLVEANEIAKQRAADAEWQSRRAEERSALLAANVAKGLIGEGQIDQAILLLLSNSYLFDDTSAPDEVLIPLDNALRKKSLIETFELSQPVTAFEGRSGIFLFEQVSHDLLKIGDTITPISVAKGKSDDVPVQKLAESRDGKRLFLIRADLAVEVVDLETAAVRKTGQFKTKASDTKDGDPDLYLTQDGIAMRSVFKGDTKRGGGTYSLQIIDALSGATFEGASPVNVPRIGSTSAAGTYLFETDQPRGYKIVYAQPHLRFQSTSLDSATMNQIYYDGCASQVARGNPALFKQIHDMAKGANGSEANCKKYGNSFLVTTARNTSAGTVREDKLLVAPQDVRDIREGVEISLHSRLSRNNLIWVGMDPSGDMTGVISNRDVVVTSDSDMGGLVLSYRHPTAPSAARFVSPDKFLVVEAETGTIVAHDLRVGHGWRYLPVPAANPLLDQNPTYKAEPINLGSCSSSVRIFAKRSMPDGSTVEFTESRPSNGPTKSYIKVSSRDANVTIEIPEDATCISISSDGKKIVTAGQFGADGLLYDFDDVLSHRSFSGVKAIKLPVEHPFSAFFWGPANDLIVANFTDRVFQLHRNGGSWATKEIYRGENPITYAEPNESLSQLILVEDEGNSDMHGYVYSLKARETWTNLGWDYKFLDATFLPGNEIPVAKHGTWTAVYSFASFSKMVAEAKLALSNKCLPSKPDVFRTSPCWPPGFQ
jgi:TIR domain